MKTPRVKYCEELTKFYIKWCKKDVEIGYLYQSLLRSQGELTDKEWGRYNRWRLKIWPNLDW